MHALILKLGATGLPYRWLNVYEAVTELSAGKIQYSFGEICSVLRGGVNAHGQQSCIEVPQILVGKGVPRDQRGVPPLLNRLLFARDNQICLYCGERFTSRFLSRDHVKPLSRGGSNQWNNVVTACKRCNNRKGNRLLSECGMELLAVPYVPNRYEFMALSNHRILADQMEYLRRGFRNLNA